MTSNARILVVDDDREILGLLSKYLAGQGFAVSEADSIRRMQERISSESFDLIVLDIMLPDGSGLDACMAMRRDGVRTPVILLTAMQEEVDRIIGLEMGADDYMGKPFSPRELVARIKAVLRRSSDPGRPAEEEPASFEFDGFRADLASRSVISPSGASVKFTSAEFEVLKVFLTRPNRVLSREQVLEMTHGRSAEPFDRSVDVLMSRIRKKLRDAGGSPDIFKTVRNGGYQFASKVTPAR